MTAMPTTTPRWLLLSLLALAACPSEITQVQRRAASDFGCLDERSVVVLEKREDIEEPTYEVDACGHRARYTCHTRHRDDLRPANNQQPGCTLDLEYPVAPLENP